MAYTDGNLDLDLGTATKSVSLNCALPYHFPDYEITEKLQQHDIMDIGTSGTGTGNTSGALDYEFTPRPNRSSLCIVFYVDYGLPLCYIQTFITPFNVLFRKEESNPFRRSYFNTTRYVVREFLLHH